MYAVLQWSNRWQIANRLPFRSDVTRVYIDLFEIQQADNGISTVVSTHEALEWAHPFVPSLDNNLLHGYFFRNIIKSVK